MTDEQLEVAREYQEWHKNKFGHKTVNTSFVKGYIEDLKTAGIEDASVAVSYTHLTLPTIYSV